MRVMFALSAIAGLILTGGVVCADDSAKGVELNVTGLTKDNGSSAKTAIEALKDKNTKDDAKIVKAAATDADKGIVKITVNENQLLRLSQLEGALKSNKIELQRDKLKIQPGTHLVITGAKSAADIEKALAEAKLFESTVKAGEKPDEFHVIVTGAKEAPTYSAVNTALAKSSFKVSDVIWAGPTKKS